MSRYPQGVVPTGSGPRTPTPLLATLSHTPDTKPHSCSSPFYKMALYFFFLFHKLCVKGREKERDIERCFIHWFIAKHTQQPGLCQATAGSPRGWRGPPPGMRVSRELEQEAGQPAFQPAPLRAGVHATTAHTGPIGATMTSQINSRHIAAAHALWTCGQWLPRLLRGW